MSVITLGIVFLRQHYFFPVFSSNIFLIIYGFFQEFCKRFYGLFVQVKGFYCKFYIQSWIVPQLKTKETSFNKIQIKAWTIRKKPGWSGKYSGCQNLSFRWWNFIFYSFCCNCSLNVLIVLYLGSRKKNANFLHFFSEAKL